ncbi:hypothetical protein ACIBSW_40460 [Actinoplanes sp. NPDC049668]|uniref:hypothetical protein n=1 Tax=unclassified Actinoplanes TaxID=2626549 RepID=UPI0033AE3148
MPNGQQSDDDLSYADAVTVLATALDNLGARIHRDLHVESSYIDVSEDSALAEILTGFSSFADRCLAALHDPAVKRALAATRVA